MKLSFRTLGGVQVVSVAGIADSRSAAALSDALVGALRDGALKLAVDLSGVHVMTHAGLRGMTVAARLAQAAGGEVRLCNARPAIQDLLQGLGFNHLLKCDPTLALAVSRLAGERTGQGAGTKAPAPKRFVPLYHSAA